MNKPEEKITTIDEYIATFPEEIQERLQKMKETVHAAAPEATEGISYGMPAFNLHGYLVYFAGYKNHIGFYPIPSGVEAFKEEFSHYVTTKGGIQFPHDKPIPYDLVTKVVKFRVKANLEKNAGK